MPHRHDDESDRAFASLQKHRTRNYSEYVLNDSSRAELPCPYFRSPARDGLRGAQFSQQQRYVEQLEQAVSDQTAEAGVGPAAAHAKASHHVLGRGRPDPCRQLTICASRSVCMAPPCGDRHEYFRLHVDQRQLQTPWQFRTSASEPELARLQGGREARQLSRGFLLDADVYGGTEGGGRAGAASALAAFSAFLRLSVKTSRQLSENAALQPRRQRGPLA